MVINWEIIGGVVGLLVLYTKIVFDYSKIQAEIKSTNTVLIEIKALLVNHDDKIDDLDNRLSRLETKHALHHKE